ncbi:MAG: DUF2911 domain-containing protein [Chitinophagaceae bacterium]|nr:DUF2911 domain-containing protein [Chitinophagaceae bacterium]
MKHFLFLSLILATAFTECKSQPIARPKATASGKNVKITYGQPSKKGRDIFGGLVPYDSVWRTGANEATEITFAKDATFGGKPIKKGTYSLFTIPTASNWTFILNPVLKQWGAYGYAKVKDKDVLNVSVPSKKTDAPVEKLTLSFNAGNSLVVEWDQTHVEVPITN